MNVSVLLLILGMAVVTYIPRALPAVLVDRMNFSSRVEKFLELIPYTALAALIVPGIFRVDPVRPYIGIVGGLVAAVLAWLRLPMMACVIGAIAVDALLFMLIRS